MLTMFKESDDDLQRFCQCQCIFSFFFSSSVTLITTGQYFWSINAQIADHSIKSQQRSFCQILANMMRLSKGTQHLFFQLPSQFCSHIVDRLDIGKPDEAGKVNFHRTVGRSKVGNKRDTRRAEWRFECILLLLPKSKFKS